VRIAQANPGDPFTVDVNITGLTLPGVGLQGIHIHQFGDLRGFLPNAPAALAGGMQRMGDRMEGETSCVFYSIPSFTISFINFLI
jgi:hypothetical protein